MRGMWYIDMNIKANVKALTNKKEKFSNEHQINRNKILADCYFAKLNVSAMFDQKIALY